MALHVEKLKLARFSGEGWQFLTRLVRVDPASKTVVAEFDYKGDEIFSHASHFDGYLVMPGVSIYEGMNHAGYQLTQILIELRGCSVRLVGVDKFRVRGEVRPGDTVEYTCTLKELKMSHRMGKLDCVAKVNGKTVATAEGILFLLMPPTAASQ